MRIVTRALAAAHLRIPVPAETSPPSALEIDFDSKIEIAEALVLDFVDQRRLDGDLWAAEVAAWDVESTNEADQPPKQVQGAVLIQLGELWRFRGDDTAGEQPTHGDGELLHPRAKAYLYRYRDPAIA